MGEVCEVVERTNREHLYEMPCVVAMPIQQGNPAYVRWILEQTTRSGAGPDK